MSGKRRYGNGEDRANHHERCKNRDTAGALRTPQLLCRCCLDLNRYCHVYLQAFEVDR
jgi:hypothetical protein